MKQMILTFALVLAIGTYAMAKGEVITVSGSAHSNNPHACLNPTAIEMLQAAARKQAFDNSVKACHSKTQIATQFRYVTKCPKNLAWATVIATASFRCL